jgi:hypothetical protein
MAEKSLSKAYESQESKGTWYGQLLLRRAGG